MNSLQSLSADAAALRHCAEERLRELHPETGRTLTEVDTQRLLHELQVHQIELEMQQEELHHSRDLLEVELEKYSDLYDFAPVGYVTLDQDGRIQEANLTVARLLGINRSRLIKRRLDSCVSAASRPIFSAFLKKVFESNVRQTCEITLLATGEPEVDVRMQAGVAASGRECRAVLEDITEHKRAEKDRLVRSTLESTGILAGGLAHDFNNLLTIVLLNLEMAQTFSLPEKEMGLRLDQTNKAALACRELIQQLFTFAERGAPDRRLTDLAELIQESANLALGGSRVRCDFFRGEGLLRAEVDPAQIGQVIRNLVMNAREAMSEGGVVFIRAENLVLDALHSSSLPQGEYIRVSISDQGGGISKEVLSKIFDPYFSTKQKGIQKGMGLGLAISHAIVQKHGGAIVVESRPRVGTTFQVLIPASSKSTGRTEAPVRRSVGRRNPLPQGARCE